jgi:hypothetical protein
VGAVELDGLGDELSSKMHELDDISDEINLLPGLPLLPETRA